MALATANDGASKAPEALEAMECGFESTCWAMYESHWGIAIAPDGYVTAGSMMGAPFWGKGGMPFAFS